MIRDDDATIERRLVAMMAAFPRSIYRIGDIVDPENFSNDKLRAMFVAIKESFGAIGEFDQVDVLRRAKSAGWQAAEIGELILGAEPGDVFAETRAREVVTAYERRMTISLAKSIASEAEASSEDPAELRSRLVERLANLDRPQRQGLRSAREIIPEVLSRIDRRMAGEVDGGGLKTGFRSLDRMTGGMRPGELIVLAARPGMGKSALAMNIAEIVAVLRRKPTLFVSLEMSDDELMQRLLSGLSGVRSTRIRKATLSDEERTKVGRAANDLVSDAPLTIDVRPGLSMAGIAAAAQRQASSPEGLALIVIDYIQLITPSNRREPRHEQVSAISRELKQLAKRLNVPILCLAQLNRSVDSRADHRPRKSDLRESGSIEQDADVVMLVHRESELTPEADREGLDRTATLIVDKNRHGPTGDVFLRWMPSTMQFMEVTS